MIRSWLRNMALKLGWRIERVHRRRSWPGEKHRYEYQAGFVDFRLMPGDRVLDVGSGSDPLAQATLLVDRYLQPTHHRSTPFERKGKPLLIADVAQLPLADKSFDFVYCVHVLEHVDDPIAACRELMRVGRRGYIETPALAKDLLFAWAKGMHRWHVQAIGQRLVFFEYTPRLIQGVNGPAWRRIISDAHDHPLHELFFAHQDVFNTWLLWENFFDVTVFYADGRVRNHDAIHGRTDHLPDTSYPRHSSGFIQEVAA